MNDITAGAIRQALAAAASGRLTDACKIGELALAQGGDVGALNAMIGMFQLRIGDQDRAIRHLQVASKVRPADPIIANNLANTLIKQERQKDALEVLTDQAVEADKSGELLKLRAFLAQMTERYEVAVRDYTKVVEKDPDDCESWNNLGNAQRSVRNFHGSIEALKRAVALDRESAPIRLNLATALIAAGAVDEAEDELRQMAADFPDDTHPLQELHRLLKDQGRNKEALEAIQGAVERASNDVQLLLGLASHLSYMFDSKASEEVYRKVIDIEPGNPTAYLGLAVCFDLTNKLDDLAELAREVEERQIEKSSLNFIRAFDHRRAKRFAEGLAALEQVPPELESARRAHLMGQLLEGVGRYDEAFASYQHMNELLSQEDSDPTDRAAAYRQLLRQRHADATEEWAARWREETQTDSRSPPVFLVGFPRSGTTLLDTILMGHPSIEVLEEEPTLHKAFDVFRDYDNMPSATDEQIQTARDAYYEAAKVLTPLKAGNLLVDKNPLAMNALPFMRRIFPDTKIILALRHPLDVVLSCYITNFRLNAGMANFVGLETTAELYDISFSYLERVQEILPMPMHTVVYENVVADRDKELRSLFDFLELDWHDAVLDHQSTALSRGRIKTASYAQVVEPIYKRSAGRWQNYRKHLEPIIPILKPWIDKFGYEV